jgi:murein DD-endopeptidase MepM/ murein hydrolase activator NlpD
MKQVILKTIPGLLLLFVICTPHQGSAQCLCDEGQPSTPIEHIFKLDTTTASATTLIFPRFNASIGTLQCITLHDTISIVSVLGIRNLDPADKTYRFRLTVNTGVTGPNGAAYRDNFADRIYGPDLLGAAGSPTDSVSYGPDTVFDNVSSFSNVANVADFLGIGNVNLTYEIGGGVTSLAGGINFNSSVRTRTWGAFKLTYYWCPAILLAANIKSFSAIRNESRINLSWLVENEETKNTYELQMSRNGRQFQAISKFNAAQAAEGAANYQFELLSDLAMSGKVYFRVKQIDAGGKPTYSVVRFVEAAQQPKPNKVTIYPNPAKGKVSMQFGKLLNGNYKVELINLTGQVVYQQFHRMNNTNSILFDIPGTPAGIYYLRASNTQGNETFTSKLTVQH